MKIMVNTSLNKSLYIERKQIQRSHCELFCGLGKNVEVETDEKLPNRLTGPTSLPPNTMSPLKETQGLFK